MVASLTHSDQILDCTRPLATTEYSNAIYAKRSPFTSRKKNIKKNAKKKKLNALKNV
jgi:hypothetical protein